MRHPEHKDGLTLQDIANQRLHNQHLLDGLEDPVAVVRSLGAVQAQDFIGAKWGVGQRCVSTTDAEITRLFDQGMIMRTHMLRPTWHFVAPEDIRWMQELTAPRVQAFNKYYYKRSELDEATLKKSVEALVKALEGGRALTRKEVKRIYQEAGIDADGLRLGYLIMYAELEAVVCSGPLKGKQQTVALLSERAPQAKSLPREEALTEFTRRYLTSHGPATVQDLAWWSSLTIAEIKNGVAAAGLQSIELEGKTFYFSDESEIDVPSPVAHLLPNFDEYVIAYKYRKPYSDVQLDITPSYEDLSYHLILLDGQLVGGWKRSVTPKSFTIQRNLFLQLGPDQLDALESSAASLQEFLGLPVQVL